MKKFILLISFILLAICAKAQKVIQMEHENEVFKISCLVNGAKMKMIFDTGASVVSLSESMANFLYDNDYITKEDILGTSKSRTADGSIHNNVVFSGMENMIHSAMMGRQNAIKYCLNNNIDYHEKAKSMLNR